MFHHSQVKWLVRSPIALICLVAGILTSNAAHAQAAAQLLILGVDVDYASSTLYINGENFNNGSNLSIKLAGEQITPLSFSDTEITASIPVTFLGAVGSYQLTVSTGSVPAQNDALGVTLGASGPRGPMGPQGPQGPRGNAGPAGPQGPKGDTGSMGPQGSKGDAGPVGPQGLKGDRGLTGATGATGPQGPKGDAGPQGSVGPQGLPGIITAVYTAQQSSDVSVTGLQWTSVPGTTINFSLPPHSTVDLEANGSILGIGNPGHCSFRFLVDNVAYGDFYWGDVLVGSYPTTWAPWLMRRTLQLGTGNHAVTVQQSGNPGSTTAGCQSRAAEYSATRLRVVVR